MTRRLVRHLVRRQPAQFLIDQREKFGRGFAIAPLDALEDVGDIAHTTERRWSRVIAEAQMGRSP